MSIACCFDNIHRIFVKMKQSFQIARCHSEYIQFPTASCEGGLSKTCGQQGENAKRLLPANQKTPVVRVRVESGGTV